MVTAISYMYSHYNINIGFLYMLFISNLNPVYNSCFICEGKLIKPYFKYE